MSTGNTLHVNVIQLLDIIKVGLNDKKIIFTPSFDSSVLCLLHSFVFVFNSDILLPPAASWWGMHAQLGNKEKQFKKYHVYKKSGALAQCRQVIK
jgi:hypothetical protein